MKETFAIYQNGGVFSMAVIKITAITDKQVRYLLNDILTNKWGSREWRCDKNRIIGYFSTYEDAKECLDRANAAQSAYNDRISALRGELRSLEIEAIRAFLDIARGSK